MEPAGLPESGVMHLRLQEPTGLVATYMYRNCSDSMREQQKALLYALTSGAPCSHVLDLSLAACIPQHAGMHVTAGRQVKYHIHTVEVGGILRQQAPVPNKPAPRLLTEPRCVACYRPHASHVVSCATARQCSLKLAPVADDVQRSLAGI